MEYAFNVSTSTINGVLKRWRVLLLMATGRDLG